MKSLRYIVVAILTLVAVDAMAWTAEVNKAVLMLAEENLSKKSGTAYLYSVSLAILSYHKLFKIATPFSKFIF